MLSLDIDVAEQEVQAAINAAQTLLPSNLPMPPIYSKTNPGRRAGADARRSRRTRSRCRRSRTSSTRGSRRSSSQLSGVGLVRISGGQKPAVRIQANPIALSSYGIDLEALRTALVQTSVNAAKGSFDGPRQAIRSTPTISCRPATTTGTSSSRIATARRCTLTDVARVVDGVENARAGGVDERHAGGDRQHPAPAGRQHDQRRRQHPTAAAAAARRRCRPACTVTTLTDLTTASRRRSHDVEFELLLTVGLVVLVIFVFLRSLSRHDHPERRGAAVAGRHLRRRCTRSATASTTCR